MYTVVSIMKSPVVSIEANKSVAEAIHQMQEKGISSLMVTPATPGEPEGMMTKRDIISKVVSHGKDPKTLNVQDVMTTSLITVPPDYPLADAARLMSEKGIRRVLVRQGGKIIGIVSDTDIFRAVEESGWGPNY
ncbi:MAG: cyclic nucleotide-binding/CBS domain-containing protein [Candidatus Methylomirabilales bacterium]|jgi:isocitrate dehydrogenase|nr:CBS domain-containing protein [candidate division NC10 bacterium]